MVYFIEILLIVYIFVAVCVCLCYRSPYFLSFFDNTKVFFCCFGHYLSVFLIDLVCYLCFICLLVYSLCCGVISLEVFQRGKLFVFGACGSVVCISAVRLRAVCLVCLCCSAVVLYLCSVYEGLQYFNGANCIYSAFTLGLCVFSLSAEPCLCFPRYCCIASLCVYVVFVQNYNGAN